MTRLLTLLMSGMMTAGTLTAVASQPSVPFGQDSQETWEAKSFYAPNSSSPQAPEGWYAKDFDDSDWTVIQGPLSSSNTACNFAPTLWDKSYSYYWLRRDFEISDLAEWGKPTLMVMHDDGCNIYLNGTLIYESDNYVNVPTGIILSDSQRDLLMQGNNVLAVAVNDAGGGDRYIDFGLYSDPWVEVNLDTPGSLGVEILYQVDRLSDISYLKISGTLNSADWTTIRNLSNLMGLDLENANTASIPNQAFYNRSSFSYIKLPKELTSIGESAFQNTHIREVYIPATVNSIGTSAFRDTYLQTVVFDKDCMIETIPAYAFHGCSYLTDMQLPENGRLTLIDNRAFYNCNKLPSITLPQSLTEIGSYTFYETSALSAVTFPESLLAIGSNAFAYSGLLSVALPSSLSTIGGNAFEYCKKLEEAYIPSRIHELSTQFRYCSAMKKVTCATATPPVVGSNNPFYGVTLNNINLVTPEFAVADYKLDSYWLQFGKIEGGAASDFWYVNAPLTLSNGRRMEGSPSVVLQPGAKLQVTGAGPMPMKHFEMHTNNSGTFTYSQLINSSPSMSADTITYSLNLPKHLWCFFSLPFDVKLSDVYHANENASFVIRRYDGAIRAEKNSTGSSWQNLPEDYTLRSGEGYIVMCNLEGEVHFPCADNGSETLFNPNARTITLDENAAENPAHAGWNYIANPYPSYYDMYYSMLTCPVTVWNHSNRNYVAYSLIDDNLVLYPNRPFFIQASEDVNEIEFGIQGKQFTATVSRQENIVRRSAQKGGRSLFDLQIGHNGYTDRTRVVLNENASEEYEPTRDASKFFSDDPGMPQIYTTDAEGNSLAINERPTNDGCIALGIYIPTGGEYTLSLSRSDGKAIVKDALTGTETPLDMDEEYRFKADKEGYIDNRFSLLLAPDSSSGVADAITSQFAIVAEGSEITVRGCAGENVEIFTTSGMMVASKRALTDTMSISVTPGLYIVRVAGQTAKCLVK